MTRRPAFFVVNNYHVTTSLFKPITIFLDMEIEQISAHCREFFRSKTLKHKGTFYLIKMVFFFEFASQSFEFPE